MIGPCLPDPIWEGQAKNVVFFAHQKHPAGIFTGRVFCRQGRRVGNNAIEKGRGKYAARRGGAPEPQSQPQLQPQLQPESSRNWSMVPVTTKRWLARAEESSSA